MCWPPSRPGASASLLPAAGWPSLRLDNGTRRCAFLLTAALPASSNDTFNCPHPARRPQSATDAQGPEVDLTLAQAGSEFFVFLVVIGLSTSCYFGAETLGDSGAVSSQVAAGLQVGARFIIVATLSPFIKAGGVYLAIDINSQEQRRQKEAAEKERRAQEQIQELKMYALAVAFALILRDLAKQQQEEVRVA